MTGQRNRTVSLIREAEGRIGALLAAELQEHLVLADRITNLAGELVERVQEFPGSPGPLHVTSILLARLITDLQGVVLLIRHGYVAEALSLTAGMLEMAHVSMYIGSDTKRAEQWLLHDNPKRASPWTVRDTIHMVAKELGIPEDVLKREHETVYRDMNMAKHGNPIALGAVGVHASDETLYVVTGPYLSTNVRRWAYAALLYAIRYVQLTAVKYIRDHLEESPERDEMFKEFKELSESVSKLHREAAAKFHRIS